MKRTRLLVLLAQIFGSSQPRKVSTSRADDTSTALNVLELVPEPLQPDLFDSEQQDAVDNEP